MVADMIRVLLFVFGALCSQVVFAEEKEIASQEIEYLISTVEKSGCRFHRNGDSHDATRAADHLRLKLRRGKKYADSAEHFIERLEVGVFRTDREVLVEKGKETLIRSCIEQAHHKPTSVWVLEYLQSRV